MELKVELQGLKGVEDALSQAGPKLAKRALRKALLAGGNVLVAAAKSRAPVLAKGTPQRRPGELRDSIVSVVKLSSKQERGTLKVGSQVDKSKGDQSPAVYGKFVEFGSVHNRPQPYLRPAFDSTSGQALDAFTKVIQDTVPGLKS